MKKITILLVVVAVILTVTGCTSFKAEGLSFSLPNPNDVVIASFEETVMVNELFGQSGGTNLFNVTSDEMNKKVTDIIMREITLAGGNAAKNISIHYEAGFLHLFLNALTGYIWAPAGLTVSGDIIMTQSATVATDLEDEINVALAAL